MDVSVANFEKIELVFILALLILCQVLLSWFNLVDLFIFLGICNLSFMLFLLVHVCLLDSHQYLFQYQELISLMLQDWTLKCQPC